MFNIFNTKPKTITLNKPRPYRIETITSNTSKVRFVCVYEIIDITVFNNRILSYGIYKHYQKQTIAAVQYQKIHRSFVDLQQYRNMKQLKSIIETHESKTMGV